MVQSVPYDEEIFRPDHFYWFIITISKYDVLRTAPGCEGNADLDAVDDDAINVKAGITGLGARRKDIVEYKECTFKELVQLFRDLTTDINNNWARGRQKTFVFIYYAGHGVLDGFTFPVLNDVKKMRFPIEKFLRTLGTNPCAYVVGVLDCCRSKITPALRGEANNDGLFDETGEYRNTFITFGCAPSSGVDARSTIAVNYFHMLK